MSAAKRLRLAKTAVQAGKQKEARQILLQLVEEDPRNELAWLWLSDLVPTLEDRIIALENALHVNPHRTKVQQRLQQLRRQQAGLTQDTMIQVQTFAVNGRRQEAYDLLVKKLQQSPSDANAWFAFSQLVDDLNVQIVALQYATSGNPRHRRAQRRLTQLLLVHDNMVELGRAYEEIGDLPNAIRAYRLAHKQPNSDTDKAIAKKRLEAAKRYHKLYRREAANSLKLPPLAQNRALAQGRVYEENQNLPQAMIAYRTAIEMAISTRERRIAETRLEAAEKQQKLTPVRLTSPTLTLVRLSLGPFLLFLFLVLLHAGLNPLYTSPLLSLSSLSVLLGSGIIVLVATLPYHHLGEKLLGEAEPGDWLIRVLVKTLGILLLLLPFLMLLLDGFNRLADYVPDVPW